MAQSYSKPDVAQSSFSRPYVAQILGEINNGEGTFEVESVETRPDTQAEMEETDLELASKLEARPKETRDLNSHEKTTRGTLGICGIFALYLIIFLMSSIMYRGLVEEVFYKQSQEQNIYRRFPGTDTIFLNEYKTSLTAPGLAKSRLGFNGKV